MKSSIPRREWALLLLPVLGLVGVGLWAQNRPAPLAPQPTPTPGPFRLEVVEFTKLPLTPYEVFLGADTKAKIGIVTLGRSPGNPLGTWEWADFTKLRAPNSELPVYDDEGYLRGSRVIMSGARLDVEDDEQSISGGGGRFAQTLLLRLREIPADRGELELQWGLALGAKVWAGPDRSQENKIAGLVANGRVPARIERLIVRRADEKITLPVVSKNPNFEVRRLTMLPSEAAARTQPVRVALTFARSNGATKAETASVNWKWELIEADGRTTRSYVSQTFEVKLAGTQGELGQKMNFSDVLKIETPTNRKPLIVRGTISVDGAWPKIVEIPIP